MIPPLQGFKLIDDQNEGLHPSLLLSALSGLSGRYPNKREMDFSFYTASKD